MRLIEDLIDGKNSNKYLELIHKQLIRISERNTPSTSSLKLQKKLIVAFKNIVLKNDKKNIALDSMKLKETFQIILFQNYKSPKLINEVNKMVGFVFEKQVFKTIEYNYLLNDVLFEIKNERVFEEYFRSLVNLNYSSEQALSFLLLFTDLHNALREYIIKLNKEDSTNDTKESLAEKKINKITKTIINKDGTYGVEIVSQAATPSVYNSKDLKYSNTVTLLVKDYNLALTFFRCVSEVIIGYSGQSSDIKNVKNVIIHSLMQLYKYFQSVNIKNSFLYVEMNKIINNLVRGEKLNSETLSKKLSFNSNKNVVTETESQYTQNDFDDLPIFRQLKLAK